MSYSPTSGYDGPMDKTTVSEDTLPTKVIARVSDEGESVEELWAKSKRLGDIGVKTIVFPNEHMLTSWRQRIAALA